MKGAVVAMLFLSLVLIGVAEGSQAPGFVWIDASYPCVSAGSSCPAANNFTVGQQINLVVGFFVPDTDGWEVNWILTDSDGSMVYIKYVTYPMSAQSYAVKTDTVSLPAGTYTLTAAVIGRGVGKGAISDQYTFVVNSPSGGGVPLKTSVIRKKLKGDTWYYTGGGTWNDGVSSVSINGSVTAQIMSSTKWDPIASVNCFDEYTVGNFTTPSGPLVVSTNSYFTQDTSGTVYDYGANLGAGTGDVWVTSPSYGYYLSYKSPMAVGQNYGTSVAYTDGTTQSYSISVVGKEYILTGIGLFEAYRILQSATINYTSGISVVESNTIWEVPGIGSVKIMSDATSYYYGTFQLNQNFTFTLSGTSVVY